MDPLWFDIARYQQHVNPSFIARGYGAWILQKLQHLGNSIWNHGAWLVWSAYACTHTRSTCHPDACWQGDQCLLGSSSRSNHLVETGTWHVVSLVWWFAHSLQVPMSAKFGGATGQFNAHAVAFPNIDWPAFADKYVAPIEQSNIYWCLSSQIRVGSWFGTWTMDHSNFAVRQPRSSLPRHYGTWTPDWS